MFKLYKTDFDPISERAIYSYSLNDKFIGLTFFTNQTGLAAFTITNYRDPLHWKGYSWVEDKGEEYKIWNVADKDILTFRVPSRPPPYKRFINLLDRKGGEIPVDAQITIKKILNEQMAKKKK